MRSIEGFTRSESKGELRDKQGTYRNCNKGREPNVTLILLEGQRIRAVMRIVLGPR